MLYSREVRSRAPARCPYSTRAVAADPAPTRSVIALKPFNFDAVGYALRDQDVPVELLHGFKEMVGVATARAKAGESVWAVFYRWDDTKAFEEAMRGANHRALHITTAGMPPLDVYHVSKAQN